MSEQLTVKMEVGEEGRDERVKALVIERGALQGEFAEGLNEPAPAWWDNYWGEDKMEHDWGKERIREYERKLRVNLDMTEVLLRGVGDKEKRAEMIGVFDRGQDTVEVQSADLYAERRKALDGAIRSSSEDEEMKAKELGLVNETRSIYEKHREYKAKGRRDADQLANDELKHALTHNMLVDNLNKLNGLCAKHGVERLTYRNFVLPDGKSETGRTYTVGRWNDDRAIVEQYFVRAFERDPVERGTENLLADMPPVSEEERWDKEEMRMRKVVHLDKKIHEQ